MKESRIRMMDYIVHFKEWLVRLEFEIYPVCDFFYRGLSEGIITAYLDKDTIIDTIEIFDENKCLKKMAGWINYHDLESRLYFTDEEYDASELSELSELYDNHILPWCLNLISEREIKP